MLSQRVSIENRDAIEGADLIVNGRLFVAALFVPLTIAVVHFYRKDRLLLEKHMRLREKEKPQKVFVKG